MCCLATLLVSCAAGAEVNRTKQLKAYMDRAAETLAAPQVSALAQIKDDDRRYLALTYYLRAGEGIASRWGWTDAEIAHYEQSAAHTATLSEIDKIEQLFAKANPGYVLYVNTRSRSLEEQLALWQTVRSVGIAATQLRTDTLAHLKNSFYSGRPKDVTVQRFRDYLIAWRASPAPTLAAPGLSLHGRGRAYDFQIRDLMGRTIADTDAATISSIWDGQGWTEKLSAAVHTASDNFVGPLETPREPWHYEYRP